MIVADFENTQHANTIEELRALMGKRFLLDGSQVNSFELSHENGHSDMCIWVRDNLASIWYTSHPESPGFISIGTVSNLPPNNEFLFYFYGERQSRPNESVVTFAEALRVAEEFLYSEKLPKAIKWLQL